MSLLPSGSWINSAKNYRMDGDILYASLKNKRGQWCNANISVKPSCLYDNDNGQFYEHHPPNYSEQKNTVIVFLMTCVKPFLKPEQEHDRRQLYEKVIREWLTKTNLEIVVIDSSGETFSELCELHPKLKVVTFVIDENAVVKHHLNKLSSSSLESYSFLKALKKIDVGGYSHILKVTGRYYLDGVESHLNTAIQGADVYTQIHKNHRDRWQNTEYFLIKSDLLQLLAEVSIEGRRCLESNFYDFIRTHNLREVSLGPFPNNTPRGGDRMIIKNL